MIKERKNLSFFDGRIMVTASLHLPQQTATSSEDAAKHVHDHSATTHTAPAKTGASWVFVFDRLLSEIKIRDYSPKTLKAYRGWTR